MRKLILVAVITGLSACSPIGTATSTISGAAKGTMQTIGGWFSN